MTNGRRKKIPLLWGAVSERALANGFSFNIKGCGGGKGGRGRGLRGDANYTSVCRSTNLPGRDAHNIKVKEIRKR